MMAQCTVKQFLDNWMQVRHFCNFMAKKCAVTTGKLPLGSMYMNSKFRKTNGARYELSCIRKL